MKIKSIQLKPFAGISNKKVEFCPGLTVILGPNEAGKSTLLNALKSVLFTEVELTKARFDKIMKEYLPVKGGDTIRVSLEFQKEGEDYFLEKIWKPGNKNGSSILKFADQREYTLDGEISRQIDKFLRIRIGGQVLEYNKRDSRIYWTAYTAVSRVIKRIEGEDEK